MMTDRGQETFQLKVNLEDPSCNLVMEYLPGMHKALGSVPSTTHTQSKTEYYSTQGTVLWRPSDKKCKEFLIVLV